MTTNLWEYEQNTLALEKNPYPGRGIVIGRIGELAVQVYWLMGRSPNSRNRLLVKDDTIVRTVPFDPSKVEDPSLIIYNVMRETGMQTWVRAGTKPDGEMDVFARKANKHVVSNGDQTDTILKHPGDMGYSALLSRSYEPDAPNYTPRISAMVETGENSEFMISIIRRGINGETVHHFQKGFINSIIEKGSGIEDGTGLCVHTYIGDGSPLPSFDRDPYGVILGTDLKEIAEDYWRLLNADNRVALVAKAIDLHSGDVEYQIINRHEQADVKT